MVAIHPEAAEELSREIPDFLEGVTVYYIEGTPTVERLKGCC
jgi:hypothetical protein